MPQRHKSRLWRACRIYFRRFRICAWLGIFVVVCGLAYLNQIGLPDFAKRPLLEKLRSLGVDLRFSRLRLSWYRGIVAENVLFGQTNVVRGPEFSAAEARVRLNYRTLLKGQLQVDSLAVRHGHMMIPVSQTNEPWHEMVITNVESELRFLPNDE